MNDTTIVKARFAPAPTGYLHVGGARTALFNWLYVRRNKGKLVLRIEDTDAVRSTEESTKAIFESLKWLGIDWDEGPFFQSGRKEIYRKHAEDLLAKGLAYESDEVKGNHKAIIFKVPESGKVAIQDIIHDKVEFDCSFIKDIVLMKSDGTAAYNFACVVDDCLMGITHVIRGDDHLSNTPKQLLLYKALGFKVPQFAHVPLILGPDASRLSKRHGATSVEHYRKEGYLDKAFVNFLSLLGWAPGDDREKMSIDEIIEAFSLDRIGKKGAIFDLKKLQWLNGVYIREMDVKELCSYCRGYLESLLDTEENKQKYEFVIALVQERLKTFAEVVPLTKFFFAKEIKYGRKAVKKYLLKDGVLDVLDKVLSVIEDADDFSIENLEKAFVALKESLNVSNAKLIHPVRVSITGIAASPPIFETIVAVGKDACIKRIKDAMSFIKSGEFPYELGE
ncbi:MAG: glutamate--tRNA ligase [Candidatus Aureabacteria bacterium]|nr:glutamate--tRNA ligase [Candidatus Auribacterota bacterium]